MGVDTTSPQYPYSTQMCVRDFLNFLRTCDTPKATKIEHDLHFQLSIEFFWWSSAPLATNQHYVTVFLLDKIKPACILKVESLVALGAAVGPSLLA